MKRATRSPSTSPILIAVSDLHCGGSTGLHPDTPTPLDDGGAYTPSPVQAWNFANWLDFWRRANEAAEGKPLRVIVNGDAVDGCHHKTVQIISLHPGIQCDILMRCWAPVLDLVKIASFTVIRGTAAHVGEGAPTEEAFARWLARQKIPVLPDEDTGTMSWRHFKGELAGVTIDATHHGRTGGRLWTSLGGAANLAVEIMAEYANRRELPPTLAIRSHKHKTFDTHDNFRLRLLATCAWQLGTDWVKQAVPESLADLGGHIITCADGRVRDIDTVRYLPTTPTRWRAM